MHHVIAEGGDRPPGQMGWQSPRWQRTANFPLPAANSHCPAEQVVRPVVAGDNEDQSWL